MNEHLIWAEIRLDAIAENIRSLRRAASSKASLMAMVKANGYGHGAVEVARTALASGAASLGVARMEEGIALRTAGFAAPILVFGPSLSSDIREMIRYRLTPSVYSMDDALRISETAMTTGKKLPVHLKFDTGMGRLGFTGQALSDPVTTVRKIGSLPGLRIQGVYTHLATADHPEKEFTRHQIQTFSRLLAGLEEANLRPPIAHAANSAGLISFPECHFDMVRPGIAIYGIQPSLTMDKKAFSLQPALSLKTRIVQIKTVPAGFSISYGRTWTASKPTAIATLACGYGDGFPRLLSNNGEVLVRGRRAPLRGRICMDLCMVDVSGIPDVRTGDTVTLIGKDGGDEILTETLAESIGTIGYELVTGLMPRVPRVIVQH
ncbi:alanine racemase [Desulfobotulus alkaliphilus]|uniref:Alanine racemase n=1 Tax=Desulfobotulus alkaliphilus TaxID=622671 RepID=A0A562RFM1_9BACT|nr:alanine racemase [Desulfobotulus alkaliphilus]TWI67808.1 alanine racemase [Desulfobotulus alkaliphilus]